MTGLVAQTAFVVVAQLVTMSGRSSITITVDAEGNETFFEVGRLVDLCPRLAA